MRIEEGGIFALYSKNIREDLVGISYYGLYALQHRGQESAGITTSPKLRIISAAFFLTGQYSSARQEIRN